MSRQGKPEWENLKFEVAREYGIDLKRGYSGGLSSTDTGRVGGQMVRRDDRGLSAPAQPVPHAVSIPQNRQSEKI